MPRAVGTHTNTQDAWPALCSLSSLSHAESSLQQKESQLIEPRKPAGKKGLLKLFHVTSSPAIKSTIQPVCLSPLTLSHAKPGDCKMDSVPLSQNSKLVLMFGLSHVSKWTSWLKTMSSFKQGSWCFACCYIANKRSGKGRLIWSEHNKTVYGTRRP